MDVRFTTVKDNVVYLGLKELNSEEVSKILNNDKIKMKILAIRQDCFNKTIKNQNLYSFIYVHTDGEIEIDVNVSKSKYE